MILATDGDFNVGESSDAEMVRLIEERRDQGIFLTVLGFGTGNLKDAGWSRSPTRATATTPTSTTCTRRGRCSCASSRGTLVTIAKDVKIQVEFNPARVAAYRLIGYENRALRTEDFDDDRKDAGELGAGHTVTALYEIVPAGASLAGTGDDLDSLKYQKIALRSGAAEDRRVAHGSAPLQGARRARRAACSPTRSGVRQPLDEPAGDFRFAAAVAGFGLVLRDSEYRAPPRWTRCWRWRAARKARTPRASGRSSSGWSSRRGGSREWTLTTCRSPYWKRSPGHRPAE